MSIDTMKQALEALEMLAKWEHPASNITTKSGRIYPHHVAKNSAATLRLAIEQAEKQEPYGYFRYDIRLDAWVQNRESDKGVPFYTAPPQRQPHELLCVCGASWSIDGEGNEELLSTPPQRQPLTEEEIDDEWEYITGHSVWGGNRSEGRTMYLTPDEVAEFARAIERKHGIGGGV